MKHLARVGGRAERISCVDGPHQQIAAQYLEKTHGRHGKLLAEFLASARPTW